MKAQAANQTRFVEAQFFDRAEALREQLEHALGSNGGDSSGFLGRVSSAGAYEFLLATADQVFSHDLALAFLNRLRQWGKEKSHARHTSTPQAHLYADHCWRALAQDATPARWHYLYSLSRKNPAPIRLLVGNVSGKKWISVGRVDKLQLGFNHLLVHPTSEAYAIDGPQFAAPPLEGTILLHGYLW
ncbi:MAG: hypothetical protein ACRD2G_13050 [Terriglobia bacterium]